MSENKESCINLANRGRGVEYPTGVGSVAHNMTCSAFRGVSSVNLFFCTVMVSPKGVDFCPPTNKKWQRRATVMKNLIEAMAVDRLSIPHSAMEAAGPLDVRIRTAPYLRPQTPKASRGFCAW